MRAAARLFGQSDLQSNQRESIGETYAPSKKRWLRRRAWISRNAEVEMIDVESGGKRPRTYIHRDPCAPRLAFLCMGAFA